MAQNDARTAGQESDARTAGRIRAGWKDVLRGVLRSFGTDRVLLVAAGVTFYLILALFPALAAFVSLYGLVADPATISGHVERLGGVLPEAAVGIVSSQLDSLAGQDRNALGFGFALGLAVALWSANGGIKALFQAMNIAYEETEKRGFLHLNLLALGFTLGAILMGMIFIFVIGVVPALLAFLNLGRWAEILVTALRWTGLLAAVVAASLLMYRYGPSREHVPWRRLRWGVAFATLGWFAASWAFSFYLENFADYNATYGTLGAAIGMMMWIWISTAVLITGAEINAEIERQTTDAESR